MKSRKVHLSQDEVEFIKKHILKPLRSFEAQLFLFGSRVKGNHSKYSDVDILIKADEFSSNLKQEIAQINEYLIESNFPYKVDIVLECDLAESYREDIFKNLVEIDESL